jgi:hypothetical protein
MAESNLFQGMERHSAETGFNHHLPCQTAKPKVSKGHAQIAD